MAKKHADKSLLKKSSEIIATLGSSGLEIIEDIVGDIKEKEREQFGSIRYGVSDFIADRCLDLVRIGGYDLLNDIAGAITASGPYEHERSFRAFVHTIPDIVRNTGTEALRSIAVIGNNMSHVTWQISHAVDFMSKIPQIIIRLSAIYDKKQILKFFCMLEGLSIDHYNFHRVVSNLDGYLRSLEKCGELGIADKALDLTCLIADAHAVQAPDVFQFWMDFAESVYDVNIKARDGRTHPDAIREENKASLENLIGQITIESEENPRAASYLIGYVGKVIEQIGYDGLDTVVIDYIRRIPADSGPRAQVYLEVLKCCPEIIRALLVQGDRTFVRDTYQAAGALNKDLHLLECTTLLKRSAEVTGRIGLDGFRKTLELYKNIIKSDTHREDADEDLIRLMNESASIINAIENHGGKQLVLDVYGHAERLSAQGSRLPYVFLKHAPEIIKLDGPDAIEKVSRIISGIAPDDHMADCLLQAAPVIIKHLGYDGISKLARLGRRISIHNEEAASTFIDHLPLHLSKLDYMGLSRLADRTIEISITHWKNAESFAKGETREYLDYCDYINEGLHLKHIKPVLSNYLEALLGYQIEIRPALSANTNGEVIFLPEVVKDFKDDAKNLLMYKVQSTHVEAH
ncbi:MAG: hypothetical protein V3S89_08420, partial [Desulfobacterales bacterium]